MEDNIFDKVHEVDLKKTMEKSQSWIARMQTERATIMKEINNGR